MKEGIEKEMAAFDAKPKYDRFSAKSNGGQSVHPLTNDWATYGLTKREMFAAMAMSGWLASFGEDQLAGSEGVAAFAVKCADALLAELAKGKKE